MVAAISGVPIALCMAKRVARIELAVTSVTSPGNEADLPGTPPDQAVRAYRAANRQLRWANLHRRGYATLHLTPQRATAEWLFLRTVRERSTAIAERHVMTSVRGANRYG